MENDARGEIEYGPRGGSFKKGTTEAADKFLEKYTAYDFSRYVYWNLRGKWRQTLWDWTRRPFCDATAEFTPKQVTAGEPATVTLKIKIGKNPLEKTGARIAIYFPIYFGSWELQNTLQLFKGPDGEPGYSSLIAAETEKDEVELETK
ncbi:MAG: hypothetical protein ACYTFY_11380, partial [Planctomycetota bacterium]